VTGAAFQAALSAWVIAATGLDDARVVWTGKAIGLGLPPPYVTFNFQTVRQIGQPRLSTVEREAQYADPGEELESLVETSHESVVTLTAWAADPTPVLLDIQRKASLPSIRNALRAAGVGLAECRLITESNGVVDGRAAMSVRLYTRETVTEYLTYVSTAEATNTTDLPVTLTLDFDERTASIGSGG
jgi:hypothetical protein